jgi:hypothetical protein
VALISVGGDHHGSESDPDDMGSISGGCGEMSIYLDRDASRFHETILLLEFLELPLLHICD